MARLGYFYGLGSETHGFTDLPLWLGARYYLTGGREGLHVGVEPGLNDLTVRDVDHAGRPNTLSAAMWGANFPINYKAGAVEIQAQLSTLTLTAPGASLAAGITLGYDIGRF